MIPIDTYIITGTPAAGKTTLLNRLLAESPVSEMKTALIINEFGAVGVDGALIQSTSAARYEINSGSLYCVCTAVQLRKALDTIVSRPRPDLILIETTGVAEPSDLLTLIDCPSLALCFNVRATVAIADARNFIPLAAFMRAACRQVEAADGILVNKIDLVGDADLVKLNSVLDRLNPSAERINTVNSSVDFRWLESLTRRPRSDTCRADAPPERIFTSTFRDTRTVDRQLFEKAVALLDPGILRLKGNVDFGGESVFVELDEGRLKTQPAVEFGDLRTVFTVIAWDITGDELSEAFEKCFLTAL